MNWVIYNDDAIVEMTLDIQEFLNNNTLIDSQSEENQNAMEEYEQAIKDFSCAMQFDPNLSEKHFLRGKMYMLQKLY